MHDAEVNERVGIAEHVARFLAAQIDLMMLDVFRSSRHRPAIEADDLPAELVVKPARDDPTEPSGDAGDHDRASPEHVLSATQALMDHALDAVTHLLHLVGEIVVIVVGAAGEVHRLAEVQSVFHR